MRISLFLFSIIIIISSCNQASDNASGQSAYMATVDSTKTTVDTTKTVTVDVPNNNTIPQSSNTTTEDNSTQEYYIGDSEDKVLSIQGTPTRVQTLGSMTIYSYDFSSLTFENGILTGYSNLSKNLLVSAIVKNHKSKEDEISNSQTAQDYLNEGNNNFQSGELNAALISFNNAIRLYPAADAAYYNRAILKSKLGDYKGAIKDYTKSMQLNSAYITATTYYNRGFNKGILGDYNGALQDYNDAIEINPSYAYAYYNRGLAKYKLGNKDGACSDWREASELGDSSAVYLINNFCN